MSDDTDTELDIGSLLGSSSASSVQVLTLYIPDRDRAGKKLRGQQRWVREAAELLALIGGGVTIMPPVEGGWLDEAASRIIWENPILVYTYVKPDRLLSHLGELRAFLHRLGRETRQGEVGVEFDGEFYRITDFDPDPRKGT